MTLVFKVKKGQLVKLVNKVHLGLQDLEVHQVQ